MQPPNLFRPARPRSRATHLGWTLAQSAVLWGALLWVAPTLLVAVESRVGISGFDFSGRTALAVLLFAAYSALNLATGAVLSLRGHGTPLPLAAPRELVLNGPYRHVRNPMAIAGIGQGVAVALWLGSWMVLLYAAAGALAWHAAIRPAEERDLAMRFGDAYRDYRGAVPLWWPRWTPYVPLAP